jgi:hypothetical protein|tara:strand:- start:1057 stop:1239 length:183 start_codon:yes stop_codon:yes gene_type:complete
MTTGRINQVLSECHQQAGDKLQISGVKPHKLKKQSRFELKSAFAQKLRPAMPTHESLAVA